MEIGEAAACNQARLDRKYAGRGCGPDHRENDHEESARFTLGDGHMRFDPDPVPAQHRPVRAGRLIWTGYLQYLAGSTCSQEGCGSDCCTTSTSSMLPRQ